MKLNLAELWMRKALEEAALARDAGEVPVGAVVVKDGLLLGRGGNRTRGLSDPTAHAEIIAVTSACNAIQQERLEGCDLFVTLEPCAMCAGAITLARIKRLFFAVHDPKAGACGSLFDIPRDPRLNHRVEVYSGLLAEEAGGLLEAFFRNLRSNSGA